MGKGHVEFGGNLDYFFSCQMWKHVWTCQWLKQRVVTDSFKQMPHTNWVTWGEFSKGLFTKVWANFRETEKGLCSTPGHQGWRVLRPEGEGREQSQNQWEESSGQEGHVTGAESFSRGTVNPRSHDQEEAMATHTPARLLLPLSPEIFPNQGPGSKEACWCHPQRSADRGQTKVDIVGRSREHILNGKWKYHTKCQNWQWAKIDSPEIRL